MTTALSRYLEEEAGAITVDVQRLDSQQVKVVPSLLRAFPNSRTMIVINRRLSQNMTSSMCGFVNH